MIFRTHVAFAFLLGIIFLDKFNENKVLFLLIVLISSVIPDIDHPYSKIGRKFGYASRIINFLFGHRKLLHSLFFVLILSFSVYWFLGKWWQPLFLGYTSHLVIDAFSKEGINFIYPINQIRLQGFIKTGGIVEAILFWIVIFLDLLLLYIVIF